MAITLSNTARSRMYKIFWIIVGWTFISTFYFFSIYASLIDLDRDISDLDPWIYFKGSLLTGLFAGIVGGSLMVFYWERWLRTRNYGWSLLSILGTFTVLYFLVGIPTGLFVASGELNLPFFHHHVLQEVLTSYSSLPSVQSFLFWLFVVLGTLIMLLVNDKYGPGVFRDFLLGKYFQPKREERIFMFLDLRSSTVIAEQLGEQQYFSFLKDTYKHATPSILNAKGEIYQYVGDEIVISWKMNEGVVNANCLNCFFQIQQALQFKAGYYHQTYNGLTPEFKAGLHYGHVMAGEIGVVKRDIAFSGDVLNTAARIQGKCNELGVNILFSSDLLERLNLLSESLQPKKMGDMALRGKQQKVLLYTI